MKLPTKIINLEKAKLICNVPKFLYFSFQDYKNNQNLVVKNIQKKLKKKIIIRSASFNEDGEYSNAGKYLSLPNIKTTNFTKIKNSIEKVFKSYGPHKKNQFILVQEYIQNAESVGVIFTADPKNGSPFRTINFNESNSTDLITSGKSNGQIIYFFKDIPKSKIKIDKKIKNFNNIIKKLEKKFSNNFLDIEFIIYQKKIYILQVRKLKIYSNSKINFKKSLRDLEKKILKMTCENSHLIGKKRFFSTMTDWNPAEIIGLKPKPLALSLYKSLITDEIWSESRVSLGYKDITKMPLLYSFLGTPYIDLKTDINSFLIPDLSNEVQKKLLKFYLRKFKQKPYFYYDKIESELVLNCISLDTKKYKKIIQKSSLTKKELNIVIKKYKELTISLILRLDENIKKYNHGKLLFKKIKSTQNSIINKIYLLHNICKNYGTLPFANLARMAFIAIEFLNSFVSLKIISNDEKKIFLETIKSVSFEMSKDLSKSKFLFLKKYGHLRPNTYEISNQCYNDNFKNYFRNSQNLVKRPKKFKFTTKQINKINYHLNKKKFENIDAKLIINFIENSIYQREKSKFFFTEIINEIFNQLKILARGIKLKESDLQYLDIYKILELYEQFDHEVIVKDLKNNVNRNRNIYRFNQNFNLPNVILDKNDLYIYHEKQASPTFITDKEVLSEFINLNRMKKNLNLNDKIICIENADPGYDFIFSCRIKGLITAFGGPNSHMSIRCNEFSVPAAIGIGEKKFQQLLKKNRLYLNCKKRILNSL